MEHAMKLYTHMGYGRRNARDANSGVQREAEDEKPTKAKCSSSYS
jgi:hypothetical protein